MGDVEETKYWFINTVLPELVKSRELTRNFKISSENGNESFKLIDVSISLIGLEEAFMLTKCYRIKLVYAFGEEKDTCCLIAKRTPTTFTPENYEACDFENLFHNEIEAYKTIIPTLMEISKSDKKDYDCPKYYYSSIKKGEASIVLGDFSQDGFQMSASRVNLSLEHILLGAEHIGFFHGLCYALKTIDKNKFEFLASLPHESRYSKPPPKEWEALGEIIIKRLSQAVTKFFPEINPEFMNKLIQLLNDHYNYSKKRVQPIEPFATLCHGDYLRNNIAFAYEDQKDPMVPKKAMMFDFQTLRYSSPMVDLCLFLTISSGKDVRIPNFDTIFDTYYRKLASTFINHANIDLPDYLSRSHLLKEYTLYLPYSFAIATFFLPNMHEPNNLFSENMLGENFDHDALVEGVLALGGDDVDKELASLVKEMYELTIQENVDVFDGFINEC